MSWLVFSMNTAVFCCARATKAWLGMKYSSAPKRGDHAKENAANPVRLQSRRRIINRVGQHEKTQQSMEHAVLERHNEKKDGPDRADADTRQFIRPDQVRVLFDHVLEADQNSARDQEGQISPEGMGTLNFFAHFVDFTQYGGAATEDSRRTFFSRT